MFARLVLPIILVGAIAVSAACLHPEEREVTYGNGTQSALTVFSDGYELTTLEPGESTAFRTRKDLLPDHIEAYDEAGNLRFDKVITWEELEANGFRLVITEESLAPTPTPGP